MQYKQLFNVFYADGVRMTTIGGVIFRADQAQRFAACEFSDFEFVREGDDPFEIKVLLDVSRTNDAFSRTAIRKSCLVVPG